MIPLRYKVCPHELVPPRPPELKTIFSPTHIILLVLQKPEAFFLLLCFLVFVLILLKQKQTSLLSRLSSLYSVDLKKMYTNN